MNTTMIARPPGRRLAALTVLTVLLVLAAAPAARAGSYVVVGCADLDGALGAGHTVRPTDGWHTAAGGHPTRNDCNAGAGGRGLFAVGERGVNLFRFDAPPGTTIERLVTTYRAHLSGAAAWAVPSFAVQAHYGEVWGYIPPSAGNLAAAPRELAGRRAVGDARGAKWLQIGVRCDLQGPCATGGAPWASFHALAVVLTDDRAPAVGLTAPRGHVRGTIAAFLTARDEGGGVFARALELDGRRIAGVQLCPTVRASVGPQRHVTRRVPCPLDAPGAVALDTRSVADGAHELVARVEDVAGNVRSTAARIVVDNLPPRAGTVALAGEPSEALTARPSGFLGEDVAYDYRWERCAGAGCTEIGGALSRTYRTRAADAGHRLRAVVTASDGGGAVRVASAPSAHVPAPAVAPSGAASPRTRLTAWLERGRRRLGRATVTWPTRVRIRGRLTDLRGRPLARTPVRMLERIDGRRRRAITGVRTRRDGRLTTFTRIGPSRQLQLVHGSAAVTLRLRVRAPVRLRVRRSGRITRVMGRVLGGRVPRAGLRVRLQSRGFGAWRTRALLRTDGLGRFSASGQAPVGARLRVVVPAQRGYPYARGVSR